VSESPLVVGGHCAEPFAEVRRVLVESLAAGEELGASLAVDIGGETVVDVWGGYRDRARTQPWERNTVVNLWSISKTVTALATLLLVDRGDLDLDAPVARYWPEFAAHGKESVLVRHILAHSSGVAGWEPPFTLEQMCDTDTAATRLAGQRPRWEPGSASGYHAQNQGHLLGELVRRVTGVRLREFVRTEIAEPLGADLQIGATGVSAERIAELEPPPPTRLRLPDGADRTSAASAFGAPPVDALAAEESLWRRSELGALNAHGNARSVARVLSVLSCGGAVNGRRWLSKLTAAAAFVEQTRGIDRVLGIQLRWGLGLALPWPEHLPLIPAGDRAFWGGWGGSMVVVDRAHRATIAYTMNRMGPDVLGSARAARYLDAAFAALG
jgi:CubicO group peptidase (beta-lactamase class C family)